MIGCSGKPDESQCQFECEMTLGNGNEVFEDLLRVNNKYTVFLFTVRPIKLWKWKTTVRLDYMICAV